MSHAFLAVRLALASVLLVAPPLAATAAPVERVDADGAKLFEERQVTGAFVLLDLKTGALTVVSPERASTGYLPASTFKIPNTLIGLETGVIPDERFALKWDGVERQVAAWNRDHDLASAMRESVVWFYQEVARRIGAERMKSWIDRLGYGNRDLAGGIDQFWLSGGLRVTPREQVEFMRRLRAGELPVSRENAALVLRLLPSHEAEGATLRGKTGLGRQGDTSVGWLVGIVERGDQAWAYATLVLGDRDELDRIRPLRLEVTKALLARHGVLSQE
jgi:beta-lactamase class D